jgi:hypothetical protein
MGFGNYFTPPHRKSVKGLLAEQLILQAGNLEMDVSRQGAQVNPMGGEGDGLGEGHEFPYGVAGTLTAPRKVLCQDAAEVAVT